MKKNKLYLFGKNDIQNKFVIDELNSINGNNCLCEIVDSIPLTFSDESVIILIEFGDFLEIRSKLRNELLIICNYPESEPLENLIGIRNMRGLLCVNSSAEHLIQCVEHVKCGDLWLPRELMSMIIKKSNFGLFLSKNITNVLTRRESEIVIYMSEGYTNRQISEMLYVSENTIKSHINKIYRKLRVKNRVEMLNAIS